MPFVKTIATGFSSCIVSSIQKANNDEANYAIELIATQATEEEISAYFDSLRVRGGGGPLEVYEKESKTCVRSIEAGYGLAEI